MAIRSGIVTKALFDYAAKHDRLARYLTQGSGRAVLRTAKAAVDGKARAINQRFNLRKTNFSGISRIKRQFVLRKRSDIEVRERLRSSVGIPLRDFGAKETKRGLTYSVRRGQRSVLPRGFIAETVGGHAFTRVGRSRLPIRKRFGPGLAVMADNDAVRNAGLKRWDERINSELRKEEDRAWSRARLR